MRIILSVSEMKLSIITPIFNCDWVLEDLILWFNHIKSEDIELVVVDQTRDRSELVSALGVNQTRIQYIYSKRKGLSLARNIALGVARGSYVCFFDDTARPFDGFRGIFERLEAHDFVLGAVVDESGRRTSYSKVSRFTVINRLNVVFVANSNAIFCKRACAVDLAFDERMGVGRYFGSCEELDFLFRAVEKGYVGAYEPKIRVCHPVPKMSVDKAKSYALGHYFFTSKLLKRDIPFGLLYCFFKVLLSGKKIWFGGDVGKSWGKTYLGACVAGMKRFLRKMCSSRF